MVVKPQNSYQQQTTTNQKQATKPWQNIQQNIITTGQPTWVSKTILIKVNGNCRTTNGDDNSSNAAMTPINDAIHLLTDEIQKENGSIPQENTQASISVSPNPASNVFNIMYELPTDQTATIELFNMTGQKIADIIANEAQSKGHYMTPYNSSDLPSGLYLVVLNTEQGRQVQKIVKQ